MSSPWGTANSSFPPHTGAFWAPISLLQSLPALDTDSQDGLQALHGLSPAVEKSQFPQECLEFPPLCSTRLQVPALMRENLHSPAEYSHSRAASLNNPSHHPKPMADELPSLLLRASKTLRYIYIFFKCACFDLNLTAQSRLCLFFSCLFATLQEVPAGKKNPYFLLLLLNYQSFILFCKQNSHFLVYYQRWVLL